MDIAVLLNAGDGADTDWCFEVSDTEEGEPNGTGGAEGDDVSSSEVRYHQGRGEPATRTWMASFMTAVCI
ncbi:hypothetical protein GN958_ATG13978 [Phytophthora infestans]|uniref:Uncharacterized protein n=1 Tax=Phytophthora infestans TaxID=4787 RepID=A0A8S9UBY9_PHYIN|nr:hypothetical protein GN958_ATG13978 [Phytophthora infestans]